MVKTKSGLGSDAKRILAIAAVTSFLVACGGGASDDPLGQEDFDGDDIINSEDPDADGDGIDDFEDNFVDLDSDDLDDFSGLTEEEANAAANTNPDDLDGDGYTDVSATHVCGSESGSDNDSSTNAWNDNCTVERQISGGQFADSLFTVGIQRVLFCSGHGNASSYAAFADGEFGPGTESAVMAYQTAEGLNSDGVVGAQTWASLQSKIELLSAGNFNTNGEADDTYGFTSGPCANIAMFYQAVTEAAGGGVDLGQWSLARNQPNETETVPFSYENSFISAYAR